MKETEKPIVNRKLRPQRKFMSKYSKLALIPLILWPLIAMAGLFSLNPTIIAIFVFYPIPLIIGVIGEIIIGKASIYDQPQPIEKICTFIAFVSAISPFAVVLFMIVLELFRILVKLLDKWHQTAV